MNSDQNVFEKAFLFVLEEIEKLNPNSQRGRDARMHINNLKEGPMMPKPTPSTLKPVAAGSKQQDHPNPSDQDPSFGGQGAGLAGHGLATGDAGKNED